MKTFLQIFIWVWPISMLMLMLFVRAEIVRFRSWTEKSDDAHSSDAGPHGESSFDLVKQLEQ